MGSYLHGKMIGNSPYFFCNAISPCMLVITGIHESTVCPSFIGFHNIYCREVSVTFTFVTIIKSKAYQ